MNQIIEERLRKLGEIVQQYPKKIPIDVAAEYMGVTAPSMRTIVEQNAGLFGVTWSSPMMNGKTFEDTERNYFCIPTLAFISFATGGNLEKVI